MDSLVFRPKPSLLGGISIFALSFTLLLFFWIFIEILLTKFWDKDFITIIVCVFFELVLGFGLFMISSTLTILLPLKPVIINQYYIEVWNLWYVLLGHKNRIKSSEIHKIKILITQQDTISLISVNPNESDEIQFINTINQKDLKTIYDNLKRIYNIELFEIKEIKYQQFLDNK